MKNKKYKIILNTTAITAVSAVGISTVVSCGSGDYKKTSIDDKNTNTKKNGEGSGSKKENSKKTGTDSNEHSNVNKPRVNHGDRHITIERDELPTVDGMNSWRFNNQIFTKQEEAETAREDFINSEIDKVANATKVNSNVYEYNGNQYETRQQLLNVLKKEYKLINLFADTNYQNPTSLQGYQIGDDYFKTAEEVAKAYIANNHGDGSGNDYEYRLYDKNTKTFATKKTSILGLNKRYEGARDNGFYVPKSLTDKVQVLNSNGFVTEILKNPSEFKFQKIETSELSKITESTDLEKYKKELLDLVWEFAIDEGTWKGSYYTYNSSHVELEQPTLVLSSRKVPIYKGSNGKFWLFASGKNDRKVEQSSAKNLMEIIKEDVKTFSDAEKIWDIITKKQFHTIAKKVNWFGGISSSDRDIDWGTLKSGDGYYKNNKRWANYKKDSMDWNFKKRFEAQGKWFETKVKAEEYVIANPIITHSNSKLDFSNINGTAVEKRKAILDLLKNNKIDKIIYLKENLEGKTFQEIELKYETNHPITWSFNNKIHTNKQFLIYAIKDELKDTVQTKVSDLININEIGKTIPIQTNKNAILGINEKPSKNSGDFSGNTYERILTNGDTIIDIELNPIEGHNYSYEEITKLLEANSTPNDKNLEVIKRTYFTTSQPQNGVESIGKAVINVKTNTNIDMHNVFLSNLQNDDMLYQASNTQISNSEWFKWQGSFVSREQLRKEYRKTYERLHEGELYIDELIVNTNEEGTFDNIFLPSRNIVGPMGNGTIESLGRIANFIRRRNHSQLTVSVKHSGEKLFKEVSSNKNITNLSNGDVIKITVQKEHSLLTRIIEVKGLKRNILDFFKGSTTKDKVALGKLLDSLKNEGLKFSDDMKEKFKKFTNEFKDYLKIDLDKRDKKKVELIKSIHAIHELIDNGVFGKIVTNDDSITNKLIKTLEENGVDTTSISDDGWTLKPKLKTLINDALDILKVFIDNSFDFIENSIQWTPSWKTTANLIDSNAANDQDKKFLTEFKKDLIDNAGDDNDKKDVAFKTVKELMTDTLKVFKEIKDGKTIYHVIKDVNSRKIVNTFRKNLKFSDVDPKGTLDNFHIKQDGSLGKKLKYTLSEAIRRRENGYNKTPTKSIYNTSSNPSSLNLANIDINWILNKLKSDVVKKLLPMIKGQLNGSLDYLLNLASSVGGGLLGVDGIANIKDAFNSISGVSSDAFIETEANIQGLLTYIFGDEGHVVMEFEEKDDKFVLKNYYSPEITTIARSNRDTIIYRKDDLEKLFNNIKPLINLLLNLVGSL